jgi:transcription antitermination factor NusG
MSRYQDLSVGDVMPIEGSSSIVGEALDEPKWFIFRTAPQAELASIVWLERNGVDHAWCPTTVVWQRLPGHARRKVRRERVIAPGYVFARFRRRPIWHVLRERSKRKLVGVVSKSVIVSDGRSVEVPVAVDHKDIMRMKHVPERIARIRAREIEKARTAAVIRPGDSVDVLDGALEGWTLPVDRIDAGIAYFIVPLFGGREIGVEVGRVKKSGT